VRETRRATEPKAHRTLRRVVGLLVAAAALATAALAAEAVLVARLDPAGSDPPVRLYARPPVLVLGQYLDAPALAGHLSRIGYEEVRGGRVGPGQFARGRREWLVAGREIGRLGSLGAGLAVRVRLDGAGRVASLEDRDGQRYRVVPLEPEPLTVVAGAGRRDCVPVRLEDLPDHLIGAILTVEDQRFYRHGGLDYLRIGAAALANLRDGRVVQGGSTITQQLARSLFLDSRRTLVRKVREASMALVLEARHSKSQILEAYLNEVYLGHHDGLAVHGVGRAAEVYFGKDASRLDLAESALLAGMIRGPNLYSPVLHPDAARERRGLVLRLMRDADAITEQEWQAAREAPIEDVQLTATGGAAVRYFTDYVLAGLAAGDSAAPASLAGRSIVTSLDPDLQRAAAAAVARGLEALERDHPELAGGEASAGSAIQAALVAVDPRTGDILAMVGGRDYGTSQYNRAVLGRRQPGSSFKPIVTLAALSGGTSGRPDGPGFTLATLLSDEPLEVETPSGPWRPANYDGRYHGAVTLREALERSLNIPFARLGLELGPERIVDVARSVGIESPLMPYPSIALGAFEVTPLEMARAYAVLAAEGYRADTRSVLGILDQKGALVLRQESEGNPVVSRAEAYLVTSALRGAVEHGSGRSLSAFGFSGEVAAKSGTSNDFRDGWFIGYTPAMAVAVWVGFDDGRSLSLSGSRAALPIFAGFMARATGRFGDEGEWRSPGFEAPPGLQSVNVDPASGLRGGPGCPGRPELFLWGTAPERSCSPYGYGSRDWAADRWEVLRRLVEIRNGRDR